MKTVTTPTAEEMVLATLAVRPIRFAEAARSVVTMNTLARLSKRNKVVFAGGCYSLAD